MDTTRKFPRTAAEAFKQGADYSGCLTHFPAPVSRIWGFWAYVAAVVGAGALVAWLGS